LRGRESSGVVRRVVATAGSRRQSPWIPAFAGMTGIQETSRSSRSSSPITNHPSRIPMFFRTLTLFRFPSSLDFSTLDELLAEHPLKPVGALELFSRGFVSPFGRAGEALSHRIGDAIWLTVGGEDRLLPSSVVNDMLAQRIAEMEEKQGRKPGGKMRKQMKEDLVHELLPRAFVRPSRTDALIDLAHGVCAVDTSSRKNGE